MTKICNCHTKPELRELARALAHDMLDRQSAGNCVISIYAQLEMAQKIVGGLMVKEIGLLEMLAIEDAIYATYSPNDCLADIALIIRERTS